MIKAILFDFDDTLVQTFNIRVDAIKKCGEINFNQAISTAQIKAIWGKSSFDDFMLNIFQHADTLENIKKKYFEVVKDFPNKLHEGVMTTLRELAPNYRLGIVTSGTKYIITHDMEVLQLDQKLFFKVQFANETEFHKPDPRVFDAMINALEKLQINPVEVLFVGDSVVDYEAATGAGFNFLAVTTGIYSGEDFSKLNAEYINEISQLIGHLKGQVYRF